MHKDIRRVDEKRGIVQITTLDERFYGRMQANEAGIDEFVWRPSTTWICDYYPKGTGFQVWLKKNGDESDQIARLAADRGYKVHQAVAALNDGGTVKMYDAFMNPTSGREEELSVEEYTGVLSYVDWWNTEGRQWFNIKRFEFTTWPNGEELAESTGYPARVFQYAGTVDLELEQWVEREVIIAAGYKNWPGEKGSRGILDMKTSLDIWPSHEMQVSAYRYAEKADWAAILQLNYRRNKKKKWKLTPVKDQFALFCSTQRIWENETSGVEPLQRDYPLEVKLGKAVEVP